MRMSRLLCWYVLCVWSLAVWTNVVAFGPPISSNKVNGVPGRGSADRKPRTAHNWGVLRESSSSTLLATAESSTSSSSSATTDGTVVTTEVLPPSSPSRAKVNEIDFCMAPSDVSLSRAYATTTSVSSFVSADIECDVPIPSADVEPQVDPSPNDILGGASSSSPQGTSPSSQQTLSLTRALNSASNRAVRRILLSRSWPSAEALNMSLRQILASSNQNQNQQEQSSATANTISTTTESEEQAVVLETTPEAAVAAEDDVENSKCPVPRPILNILMRRQGKAGADGATAELAAVTNDETTDPSSSSSSSQDETTTATTANTTATVVVNNNDQKKNKQRTNEEYVRDQMEAFRTNYGAVPGYSLAEAYLECILSLATSGVESPRVQQVYDGKAYDESYRRLLGVLQSVGIVLEPVVVLESDIDVESADGTTSTTTTTPGGLQLNRIASKLVDQDICLSMLDKISLNQEASGAVAVAVVVVKVESEPDETEEVMETPNDTDPIQLEEEPLQNDFPTDDHVELSNNNDPVNNVMENETTSTPNAEDQEKKSDNVEKERKRDRLMFWKKWSKGQEKEPEQTLLLEQQQPVVDDDDDDVIVATTTDDDDMSIEEDETHDAENDESEEEEEEKENIQLDDLGGVLLSATEPTVTRQLNVLSNIVQRALLFGGDQELLVLSETLDADKPAFVQRWYPGTGATTTVVADGGDAGGDPKNEMETLNAETRSGVQYLNCLIQLLKIAYSNGVVVDLDPPLPLTQSYAIAYMRLTASLVELGSGYIRPIATTATNSMPVPKTAKEELGRLAQWEASVRKSSPDVSAYPDDLVGSWQVVDEVGGKTIGISTVVFEAQGTVTVAPPLQGLRWRLDPGPTHLDTCTFQVLGDDGAILQYKGYVDRGARLEARFSKRTIKIRGAVTFQMRDGESALMGDDYRRDMLPINYKTGTTRFIMTQSP
eukprot:scaffold51514_cov38-Attheya_sp.AAC.1